MDRTSEFFSGSNMDLKKCGLFFAIWVEQFSDTLRVVKVPTIINLTLEHLSSQAGRQIIKSIQIITCRY
jgi:hypothetical protein